MNSVDTENTQEAVNETEVGAPAKTFTRSNPRHLLFVKSATWVAYLGMITILSWVNATEELGSLARWVVQTLPLLIVLPGMIRGKYRAYSWLCFIIVMYFIPSVMKVMAPQGEWLDSLMLAFCVVIFITSAYTSRWMQRV